MARNSKPSKSFDQWAWGAANPVEFDGIGSRFQIASQVFEKGDPKNFIPDAGIQRIADHAEPFHPSAFILHPSKVSPSRYIHTSDAETYRPIAEIVEELKVIEAEARETDKALKEILGKIGV